MAKDRPGAGTFTLQEQVKTITNEVRACVRRLLPPSPLPPAPAQSPQLTHPHSRIQPPHLYHFQKVIEKVLGSHILFDAERVEDWSDQVGANAVAALVTQCGGETKGRTYHFAGS